MEPIELKPLDKLFDRQSIIQRFRASSVKISSVAPMVDDGTGNLKQVDSYQPAKGALQLAQSLYNSRNRNSLFQDGVFKLATMVPREEALDADGNLLPNTKAVMWDASTGQASHYWKFDTFVAEDTKADGSSSISVSTEKGNAAESSTDITA